MDKIAQVTADDVMRVTKKYLTKNNRTVAILVKKENNNKTKETQEGNNKPEKATATY